jgi:hypothetical protein
MAILIASCGSAAGGPDSTADSDRPAAQVKASPAGGDAGSLRAGAWQAEVSLVSVDSPDVAPQDLERVRADLKAAYAGHDSCLRPDETHRPPQQFFSGSADGCRYEELRLADGAIGGAMACEPLALDGAAGGDPATHRIEFSGTYGPDSYSLQSEHALESADGSRRVSFVLAAEARRVGDC